MHGVTCRRGPAVARRGNGAFSSFDSDGDGRLTADELAAGQQALMQQLQGMGRGKGRGMGRNRPLLSDFDLNGDGKLMKEEFIEARGRRIAERAKQGYRMRNLANMPAFEELDANDDGMIGPQEFAAHQAQRRGRKGQ
jgi:hypothetical protein